MVNFRVQLLGNGWR